MAAVAAWDCPKCGGLRFSAEGSTNPLLAPYSAPHVCDPKRTAEHAYLSNPYAEFPAILNEPEGKS